MLQKLILISAMTLALFLFSCDDEGKLADNKTEVVDFAPVELSSGLLVNPYDYYGVQHNEMCYNYGANFQFNVTNKFLSYNGESYITKAAFDNMIDAVIDWNNTSSVYTSAELQAQIDDLNVLYTGFGLFTTINGNDYVKILKDYRGFIIYVNSVNAMDTDAFTFAMSITSTSMPGYVYNVQAFIDQEEITQSSNWSNETIGAFISVYRNSTEFWTPITTPELEPEAWPLGLNPTQAIIFADGVGALIHPIVGVIASLAEAEDQENGISVLVGWP